jgi:pyrroloquinoline-quinone synthase
MGEANGRLVKQLDNLVGRWHLLQHPFYQAWTAGTLERGALQLYAAQYYRHVQAFPEYLQALAARADDGLRPVVEENLAEELSPGRTHPELWRDFAAAVGTSPRALDQSAPLPTTRALVETFQRLCREGSLAEAVAALYVYEAQVPEIAAKKIDGLRRFYGVSEPKGLAYFAVHEEADVRHRAAWREWLATQPEAENGRALAAGEQALRALWGALDGVTPQAC